MAERRSKFEDFSAILERGAGEGADIVLLKLCYVDVKVGTDAVHLADEYGAMLEHLNREFPRTNFVAVTVPLTRHEGAPVSWIKRMLGRMPDGCAANAIRKEFNGRVRACYGLNGHLFDLAMIKSEGVDTPVYRLRAIDALDSILTTDGGHLNAPGKKASSDATGQVSRGTPLAVIVAWRPMSVERSLTNIRRNIIAAGAGSSPLL